MHHVTNLATQIEKQLPAALVDFVRSAGENAASRGQNLYLVGGIVRDMLLGRANLDLDLGVEGDAINLAEKLAQIMHGNIVTHPRFGTAKLKFGKWSVDLATARSETYDKPGVLPIVKPGSLGSDLFRRDFTINAMAVTLVPPHYGKLIDLYGGITDLASGLIRILHEKSFIDDATRIWRALRYEQRLDFSLETDTLRLLKRDIAMLDTVSGDRIRHEMELVLKEEFPEKVLRRAYGLGVLARIHQGLKGDDWLFEKFKQARQLTSPKPPSAEIYFALLAYRLTSAENEELVTRLRLPRLVTWAIRDTSSLKTKLSLLASPQLPPSRIYRIVHGYTPAAITASLLTAESPAARSHIQLYLSRLRHIRSNLNGSDLMKLGIPTGPQMKEILQRLHEARLDGKVDSKQSEEEMVKGWLTRRDS